MTAQNRYLRLQMIDILRGVALLGMAIYHFSWDLAWFHYIHSWLVLEGILQLLARIVAFSFLFLAGFSLFLTHGNGIRWQAFWHRLMIILCSALLVSIATYITMPANFIYFGILHEIALTSLAGLIFLRTPVLVNILVTVVIFQLPAYFQWFGSPWLWWLGLTADARPSFDYVPFFPWFSAGLAGLTTARIMHTYDKLQWLQGGLPIQPLDHWLQWCGRHSLAIYLVHQPILIGALYTASFVFQP